MPVNIIMIDINVIPAECLRDRTPTSPILGELLAEVLIPSGTLRERYRYRSPNLFLNGDS